MRKQMSAEFGSIIVYHNAVVFVLSVLDPDNIRQAILGTHTDFGPSDLIFDLTSVPVRDHAEAKALLQLATAHSEGFADYGRKISLFACVGSKSLQKKLRHVGVPIFAGTPDEFLATEHKDFVMDRALLPA